MQHGKNELSTSKLSKVGRLETHRQADRQMHTYRFLSGCDEGKESAVILCVIQKLIKSA